MDTFSFSSISSFKKCPLSFKFRYIDKINPLFQSIEAFMGSMVHETLEWLYKEREKKSVSLNEIIDFYQNIWENNAEKENIKVIKQEMQIKDYKDKGRECLEKYFNRVFIKDKTQTIALEKKFKISLCEDIWYRGVIDRIYQDNKGRYFICDYKTGSIKLPKDTLQLPSYGLYFFYSTIYEEINLTYEDLKNNKRVEDTYSRQEALEVRNKLIEEISIIKNCLNFPPRESMLCNWCTYNSICPSFTQKDKKENKEEERYCPECSCELLIRKGKYGEFWGCSSFPECRYTQDITITKDLKEEEICPSCGSMLKKRKGKFGKFFGCSNYPDCTFTKKIN